MKQSTQDQKSKKEVIQLSDYFFPMNNKQEKEMLFPYGLIMQPFIDDYESDTQIQIASQIDKCPKCHAFSNMYCRHTDSNEVICNFCGQVYKIQNTTCTKECQNFYYNQVNMNDEIVVIAVDITRQCGYNLLFNLFSNDVLLMLQQQIDGIRIAFCFFNNQIHYLHYANSNQYELLTFPETPDLFYLIIPRLKDVYSKLKDTVLSESFFQQIFQTTKDFLSEAEVEDDQSLVTSQQRVLNQCIEFCTQLVDSQPKQFENLKTAQQIRIICFGPDSNIDSERNVIDTLDGQPVSDYLQSCIPSVEFRDFINVNQGSGTNYYFYFLVNTTFTFLDAINYIRLSQQNGNIKIYENENAMFEADFIRDLQNFTQRVFDLNLVVQSNIYEVFDIIGVGIKVDNNLHYCYQADPSDVNYTILLKLPKQLRYQQSYIQLRVLFTKYSQTNNKEFQYDQILRVFTIQLSFTANSPQLLNKFFLVPKLLILSKYAAQASIPVITKQSNEKLSVIGGFFSVNDQIKQLVPTFVKTYYDITQQSQLPPLLQSLLRGIFDILHSNVLRRNVLPDHRNITIHNVVYGNIMFNLNLIKPKIYVCPLNSESVYTSACSFQVLNTNSDFARKHDISRKPVCVTLNRLQTMIVVIIDDSDWKIKFQKSQNSRPSRLQHPIQKEPEDSVGMQTSFSADTCVQSQLQLSRQFSSFLRKSHVSLNESAENILQDSNLMQEEPEIADEKEQIDNYDNCSEIQYNQEEDPNFEYLINNEQIDDQQIQDLQELLLQSNVKKTIYYLHKKHRLDKKSVQIYTTTNDMSEIDLLLYQDNDSNQINLEQWIKLLKSSKK